MTTHAGPVGRIVSLVAVLVVGAAAAQGVEYFAVPSGSHPHDVAPAADGVRVWFTAQRTGNLGLLDPDTGDVHLVGLGNGSRPHGVIVGPDGAAWVTDGGLNAIVRVDPFTFEVWTYALPSDRPNANLNTAAFDGKGVLWFTGQNGVYGRLDPATAELEVFDAPRGRGPYGIAATPGGDVYYASLAGSHIARIDTATGEATVVEPPTPGQGARRVWSDSCGRVWNQHCPRASVSGTCFHWPKVRRSTWSATVSPCLTRSADADGIKVTVSGPSGTYTSLACCSHPARNASNKGR